MMKTIVSVVAGFFVFFAVMYFVGFIMRSSWPDYAAVSEAMTFTLPMLFARLAIGLIASFFAGYVTSMLAPKPIAAGIAVGVVLLVFFIPVHVSLWDSFPVWYHLFFLLSLIPLTVAGARMRRETKASTT